MSREENSTNEGPGSPTPSHVDVDPNYEGLTSEEAERRLQQYGKNELEEKVKSKLRIFLDRLWGPMPFMLWAAIIVEYGIQSYVDGSLLLAIQLANATIGWHEATKAQDAVSALKKSLKPSATVRRDGRFETRDAADLVPGDLVLLGSGSAIPADCIVIEGRIEVDQAALTGESMPVTMDPGHKCMMGSTAMRGEARAMVEKTGSHTYLGKSATMIQSVGGMGSLQKLLLKMMVTLLVAAVVLCFTCFGYLMGIGNSFRKSIEFTVVVLISSIPIALEIVITSTLALGSRQLSRHGAIVTRLAAIEEMAGMNILCSDKTGTLTKNKMEVQEHCPTFMPNMDRDKVLLLAALAAKWREPPRDALDTMVLGSADLDECDRYKQTNFVPFDPTTKRTEATVVSPEGETFQVAKGAPQRILALLGEGEAKVAEQVEVAVKDFAARGIRCLAVARTDDHGDWRVAGLLTFLDPPREDTKETIRQALELGLVVKMVTGDQVLIAKEMCRLIGLSDRIEGPDELPSMNEDGTVPKDLGKKYGEMVLKADGYAQVFPEHKFLIVETLRQAGFAVGMTGDGVNDAPSLKRADVGIAVAGATDAARAASDIIFTEPGLSTIIHAMELSRIIFGRMKSYLTYRIAATVQLLLFFFIAVFAFKPRHYYNCARLGLTGQACTDFESTIPDFFELPVLMLVLIAILNDGTLILVSYDRVSPSPRPEKWRIRVLFLVSTFLGLIMCFSTLLLLYFALDSTSPTGVFQTLGIGYIPYGKVITLLYMAISIADFLTVFAARTHDYFFWHSQPHWLLMLGAVLSMVVSTVLAIAWPPGKTSGVPAEGLFRGQVAIHKPLFIYVWIYCSAWFIVLDVLKVLLYKLMRRYNVFNINVSEVVHVRDADSPEDQEHTVARKSVGFVEGKLLENWVVDAVDRLLELCDAAPPLATMRRKLEDTKRGLEFAKEKGMPREALVELAQEVRRVAQEAVSSGQIAKGRSREEADEIVDNIHRCIGNLEYVTRVSTTHRRPPPEEASLRGPEDRTSAEHGSIRRRSSKRRSMDRARHTHTHADGNGKANGDANGNAWV